MQREKIYMHLFSTAFNTYGIYYTYCPIPLSTLGDFETQSWSESDEQGHHDITKKNLWREAKGYSI